MAKQDLPSGATTFAGKPSEVALQANTKPTRPSAAQGQPDLEIQEPVPAENITEAITEPRGMPDYKWSLVLSSLYPYTFLYGLDTTIAADIQASVITTFNNPTQLAWLGAGFPMGSVAVMLLVGTLYTSFDYK